MPRGDFLSSPPPPPAQPPDDADPRHEGGAGHAAPTSPASRRPSFRASDVQSLLEGMTENQRRAVLTTEGPLLVLAGPGSGKTRVITRRIAHLVGNGIAPWRILALTFTNKAAAEMRHRVQGLLGEGAVQRGLTVTTFHSLCVRLLRRYGEMAGFTERGILKPDFTVFDADDQSKLIKNVITELNLSSANFPPRTVLSHISNAKNDLMDAEAFAATAGDFHTRTISRVFNAYQAALRTNGAADFDDLLLLTARMLRESQPVRDELRKRYRYLLVDEYQDTNRAQFVIASLLAGEDPKVSGSGGPAPNICVVGDPDQSIYGWRGADITNILQFEERYPSAQVIPLGENFRSRTPIIAAADRLIQRNKQRKHKPLIPTRVGGDKIEIVVTRDEHHEARLVTEWMRRLKDDGLAPERVLQWKDFAVFYRTNALSRVVEDAFRSAGIPYLLVRGTAFFQREEIKNALAYLRVVANPSDSVSLERIINTPARGISDATWERIAVHSATTGLPALQVCRAIESVPGLTPRAQIAVRRFLEMLDSWLGVAGNTDGFMNIPGEPQRGGLAGLVDRVIKDSGLEKLYKEEEERNENLAELVSSAAEFEQTWTADADEPPPDEAPEPTEAPLAPTTIDLLRAYLEKSALVADTDAIDPATGAVTLMTLHAAKGLEYPCVAMIGLEEMILPHSRSQESEAALEEERRLCFVGVTRAMDRLLITSARFRTIRGLSERTIPSRFLDEINGPEVVVSDQSGGGFSGDGLDDDSDDGASGDGPRFVPDGDDAPPRRSQSAGGFSPGMKVRHPQFGVGTVIDFTGGTGARVKVDFKGIGVKTLVLEYARLQRIG